MSSIANQINLKDELGEVLVPFTTHSQQGSSGVSKVYTATKKCRVFFSGSSGQYLIVNSMATPADYVFIPTTGAPSSDGTDKGINAILTWNLIHYSGYSSSYPGTWSIDLNEGDYFAYNPSGSSSQTYNLKYKVYELLK